MSIRLMLYTCKVRCYDGVVRTWERSGYFSDTTVLRHRLAAWNGQMGPAGEPYQYYETSAQAHHNDGTCCVPKSLIPTFRCLWYGREGHHYAWNE